MISKLKSNQKGVKTNLTIEYLIILQSSGIPIYSKCWGNFCAVLTVDDTLLSGFLSAITSMPKMLNQSNSTLSSVEMGFSKLLFGYTSPSGHIIVGGFRREEINDKSLIEVNKFFTQIENFLETNYQNTKWHLMSDEAEKAFEEKLLFSVVYPWFHAVSSETHNDDNCPFCSTGITYKGEGNEGLKLTFSDRLSNLYSGFKAMIMHDPKFADKKEHALKIRENVNKRANIND